MKTTQSSTALSSIRELFTWLPNRRKRQFLYLVAASLVGAAAEFAVLGSLVPFLAALAVPGGSWATSPGGVGDASSGALGTVAEAASGSNVLPLGVGLILLVLFSTILRLALAWATTRFAQALGHDLATRLYRVTLYQPYSFHVSKNTSEVLAGVSKAESLVQTLIGPLLDLIVAGSLALGIVAALMWVNWAVALSAALLFGSVYVALSRLARGRVVRNSRLRSFAATQRIRLMQEGLGGIRDTILDASQPVHYERFSRCDLDARKPAIENSLWGQMPRYVVEGVGVSIIVVMTVLVTGESGGVSKSLPLLGALAMGAQRLLPLFQRIYSAWSSINGSRGPCEDVFGLLRLGAESGFEPHQRRRCGVSLCHEIRLDHVGFRYTNESPWVFRGLCLVIPKGSRLGFAGETGCGKSTLLDVLMGLLTPCEGRVLVDGVDVNAGSIESWRRHIAHVPQAIFLTDSTIAENIAFAVPADEIDLERVAEAAQRARIHDFVQTLPQGYDTIVGERGVRLSGGQRQRIGIARALYRKADVLVLDEATSALDMQTEASVMEGVEALGKDVTVLIVAHRLATLENCDRVIDMNALRETAASV